MENISQLMRTAFERWRDRDYRSNTQKHLAKELGVSGAYVSDLLAGKRRWNNERLLAKAMEIFSVKFQFSDGTVARVATGKVESAVHTELHRKFQTILDAGPEAENAIQWNVESIYARVIERRPKSPGSGIPGGAESENLAGPDLGGMVSAKSGKRLGRR